MKRPWILASLVMLATAANAQSIQPPIQPPKYPNIAGDYICTDKCTPIGGIAKIGQDGGYLTYINEQNSGTNGFFEGPRAIRAARAAGWDDHRAVINDDGSIHWDNGTIWRKK
jgi:hypothetical protein